MKKNALKSARTGRCAGRRGVRICRVFARTKILGGQERAGRDILPVIFGDRDSFHQSTANSSSAIYYLPSIDHLLRRLAQIVNHTFA